jgi:serine/threonine-protein kinase
MGLLSDIRAGKLVDKVLATDDTGHPEVVKALSKLKEMGKDGIPRMIQALAGASTPQRQALAANLTLLLNNSTLSLYIDGLCDPNTRVVSALTEIMCRSSAYEPGRLLLQLNRPEISEAAIIKILEARKGDLDAKELLNQATRLDRARQTPLFNMLADIADETLVPELIARGSAKEDTTRMQVAKVLARFERNDTRETLTRLLADPQKNVRLAALRGLREMAPPEDIAPVLELLRDRDITVQNLAIDAVIEFHNADTVDKLIPLIEDEAEHVRRGAVEVLNELADADAIRALLSAIKDRDWWVRERAADALVKIGGPKVVEAMIELIRDDDEFIRRTAIEVLASAQDIAAFDQLLDSLEDSDWWVRERAIDALGALGDARAVPVLVKAMAKDPHTRLVAIRALGEMGAVNAIRDILPYVNDAEAAICKQAIQTLSLLADAYHAHDIREQMLTAIETGDSEIRDLAQDAINAINKRLGKSGDLAMAGSGGGPRPAPEDTEEVSRPTNPPSGENFFDPGELQPGTVLGERFQLIKRIGRGAFGTVVLFEDTVVNEKVILKFINAQFSADKQVTQRFVHEIRYARRITHANVIRIHDFLLFGKAAAISMEYFPGHTLGDEMKNETPIEWSRARNILLQITAGLAAAHEVDVVHRDIKPANILINNDDLVKVVDFGIAAASGNAETRLTRTGMVVGTPAYLAPEQVLGKPIDNRTDIYSLGIIMYQMFAGQPPYKGEDAMSLMYQHVQGTATPLHIANPEISKTVSAIVHKAMAADPLKRYQSMSELHERLAMLPTE